jgi:hypothetical protein
VIDLVGAREGDIWPDTLQHILSDGTSREVQLSDDKDAWEDELMHQIAHGIVRPITLCQQVVIEPNPIAQGAGGEEPPLGGQTIGEGCKQDTGCCNTSMCEPLGCPVPFFQQIADDCTHHQCEDRPLMRELHKRLVAASRSHSGDHDSAIVV